jgi:large subunit ribosomal protein L25
MEEITLSAQPRTVIGKQVRQLRRQGLVPAVVYGHGTEPIPVQIDERTLHHLLLHVGGNQIVKLQVGDGDDTHMVLLREIQREPIKRRVLHLDLYEVIMTERIRAEIPVVLTGESAVVERGEGLVQHGVEAVEVECLPGDLIQQIEIDVSQLTEVDQEITVADLTLSDKLEIMSDPDTVLVRVLPVTAEVVEEEVAPAAEEEVEVISHEKPEEEAAEGE